MECRIDAAEIYYGEHGDGVPLIALHGAGVDHREIEAAIEAVVPAGAYRRIYPDLPGMGRSTAAGLNSNDDVVRLLVRFIDQVAAQPALLLGHSYGAYLARAVAAQRPDSVLGLALVCPVGDGAQRVPEPVVVRQDPDAYDELDPALHAGFDEYFVVRTAATARRYGEAVAPGTILVDEQALSRVFAEWTVSVGSDPFLAPTLIAVGRCDSIAGWADASALVEHYPRATLAVIDAAGHALVHEQPELLAALLGEWLARVRARNR